MYVLFCTVVHSSNITDFLSEGHLLFIIKIKKY